MGKVVSLEEILQQRVGGSAEERRVVFLAGGFDLLHPGHIRLLEQAREMGDIVVVAVFKDDFVDGATKEAHSSPRAPITPASERVEVLAALAAVDFAFEIEVGALVNFLRRFRPDAIVDGAEPSSSPTLLAAAANESGLTVIRVALEPGHSSSRLIERINQLRA